MSKLYLCRTPLQAMYVRALLNRNHRDGSACRVIYLKPVDNKYQDFAIEELRNHKSKPIVSVYDLFTYKNKLLSFWLHFVLIIKLLLRFSRFHYTCVYLSSIDNLPFQILLTYLSHSKILTYDDGSANINNKSSYYQDKKLNLPFRFLSFLFRNKYDKKTILNCSFKHYTMF